MEPKELCGFIALIVVGIVGEYFCSVNDRGIAERIGQHATGYYHKDNGKHELFIK